MRDISVRTGRTVSIARLRFYIRFIVLFECKNAKVFYITIEFFYSLDFCMYLCRKYKKINKYF